MSEIPSHLVTVGRSFEQAYRPVLAFDGWKVAMLRQFGATTPQALCRAERHWNTNEVFILTAGEADLILFDGDETPTDAHVVPMEPHVAYDVGRSVWHHVAMSADAHIVLVEREETGLATTDYADLDAETIADVKARCSAGLR